jgi:E3 ubiquitin-protein ligase synoviolin
MLSLVDVAFMYGIYTKMHVNGVFQPSVLILFGFEYVVLAISVFQTSARYLFFIIEMIIFNGNWRNKGTWSFYVEVLCDVIRLFTYLIFFFVVFVYYGLPIHLIRDLYMAFATLRRRITQFIRYRQITSNMNERFPDATREELTDSTCIICREEMETAKKLPCGKQTICACFCLNQVTQTHFYFL